MDTDAPQAPTHETDYSATGVTPVRILPRASAALATGPRWVDTMNAVLGQIEVAQPDLVFIYVSPHFTEFLPLLLQTAWERTEATLLTGCSTTAPIAERIEAEHQPAIAMLALSLPGAVLRPVRFTQALLDDAADAVTLRDRLAVETSDAQGWIVLASSHQCDAEAIVGRLQSSYPGTPVVGGVAASSPHSHRSSVFLNGSAYGDGAVGVAIGGAYDLVPVLAQGCEPIGDVWTITGVRDTWIESISNRPALTLLAESLDVLPADMQEEAESNLAAGFAINEYQDRFNRGDFQIRTITAVDWEKGAIAVAGRPRVGQSIQFHLRDAATASLDLTLALMETRNQMSESTPVAALLHSSQQRGVEFFDTPDHDAAELDRRFPGLPHAGMMASLEIGRSNAHNALHGYSSSIGIITRRPRAAASSSTP